MKKLLLILVVVSTLCGQQIKLWDDFVAAKRAFEQKKTEQAADALWQAYDALVQAPETKAGPLWKDKARGMVKTLKENDALAPAIKQGYKERFGLSFDEAEDERDKAEQQESELREKNNELVEQLNQALQEMDALRAEVDQLRKDLKRITKDPSSVLDKEIKKDPSSAKAAVASTKKEIVAEKKGAA